MADLTCGSNCVNETDFYREIEKLKSKLKTKDCPITFYLDDDFYDKARIFLKKKTEKQLDVSGNKDRTESTEELTTWEQQTVRRKKWVYQKWQSLHSEQQKSCSKTGAVSSLVLCLQLSFPQRKANYGEVAPRKLCRNQPESSKCLHAIVPISR